MPFFPLLSSFASLQFLEIGLLLLAECVVSEKLTVKASETKRRLYVGVLERGKVSSSLCAASRRPNVTRAFGNFEEWCQ